MLTKLNEWYTTLWYEEWCRLCLTIYASHIFQLKELKWLAQVDSNHRPRAYQARALTTWAMSQYLSFSFLGKLNLFMAPDPCPVVEMMGFEPMTPCLQGRCSPNWATPPYLLRSDIELRSVILPSAVISNSVRWYIASQCLGLSHYLLFKRSFKIEQRT